MKRATWLRKPLVFIPLALLVLGVGVLAAVKIYLSSGRATRQVAERLQDLLGGRVEVGNAQIGLVGDSTVRGIQAFAEGDDSKPWLQIDDVTADMSALSALRGQSPDAIGLQGARLALRFSSSGHLVTQLPSHKKGPAQIPRLHIVNGELTLDQEGQPPMIIHGINADITSAGGALTLTGTVTDTFWGHWTAQGAFDSSGGTGSVTLDSAAVQVTMDKLRSIAFVPPKVWQAVQIEGTTPAHVRLDVANEGAKPTVHYHVEVSPHEAHVHVPSIDLDAVDATGKAIIADQIVQLEDVHGKIAQGAITTSGKLNFRDEPTRLAFKVGVKDVVLHDLPRSWKVPKNINGLLTGAADLLLTIEQGKVKTAGSGEGVISQASWGGLKIKKPIRLALHSDGNRFHFRQPQPVTVAPQEARQIVARAEAVGAAPPSPPTPLPRSGGEGSKNPPSNKGEGSNDTLPRRGEENKDTPSRRGEGGNDTPLSPPGGRGVEGEGGETAAEADDQGDGLLEDAPARLVGLLARGVQRGMDELSRGMDATARTLNKLKPPSQPGEAPTYLDVDLNLQNVDLAQLVQRLKLQLPYTIAGRLTIQVHASIPINTPGDMKAYRLRGTAKMPGFDVAGLEMTNVEARVRYADGVLELNELRGQMPRPKEPRTVGKFDGSARVQVVPQGDLRANLKTEAIPLDAVLNLLPATKGQATGVLSGTVEAQAPMARLTDPATWNGSANLTSPSIEVYGLLLQNASAQVKVGQGKAQLTTFKADWSGTPLLGEGELQLKDNYAFKAELHTGRTDLTALNRLAPSFRPPIEIKGQAELKGRVSGTLKPFRFDTTGEAHARELVAEGVTVDNLSFRWSRVKDGLKLDAIKAELYGGEVTGSAVVPLTPTATGTANVRIRNVDVQTMAKSLPKFPVRLEGKVSGTVNGELSAAADGRPRAWTSDVELTAPRLRVQGIPAEKLKGTIDSHDGKTSYRLDGESLGGTFTIKGDLPAARKQSQNRSPHAPREVYDFEVAARKQQEEQGQGRLDVRGARLSRLWDAYNITGGLSHLRGTFSISLPYRHVGPRAYPVGNGAFRIVDVRWDDELLSDNLQGDVRLSEDALQLGNITGDAAGGLFLGQFMFGLRAGARSWFQIELQQAEASRLLVPLPEVAAHVKGPVDVSLRGRIGPEWEGGGGATLVRGQVYGLDVTEWRIPMQFAFSPTQGTGELMVRDSHARIAQGRARFESTLNWGNGLRLAGTLLFYQVDLRTLLRHSPEVSSYASGRVSGRIDLSGSEMRSLCDLRAIVQAKLEQGQPLQMPVLRQITPYLRPGASSATFQSGELKGRLANCIFTIQRMTMVGDLLQLIIEGTVNTAGNLNLEVTAQTGLFCLNPAKANAMNSRLPLIGAIPRLLLYEASSLFANRVVHLRVTGTIRSPTVRLEPILLMTEEAIRFFLGRAAGLPIPAVP